MEPEGHPAPTDQSSRQPSDLHGIRVSYRILMSSKHPKPGAHKPHSQPHQTSAQHDQCNWDGNAKVSGEIDVKFEPNLITQHNSEQKETKSHNDKTELIGWLTLLAVIIYAGLTAWQGYSTQKAAKAARDAADNAARQTKDYEAREAGRIELEFSPTITGGGDMAFINGNVKVTNIGSTELTEVGALWDWWESWSPTKTTAQVKPTEFPSGLTLLARDSTTCCENVRQQPRWQAVEQGKRFVGISVAVDNVGFLSHI